MTLIELGKKYNTDKLEHGYLPFYEQTLPVAPRRVLEIGCYRGASARMWRDYFPPETEVHSLDLFVENPVPNDIPGVQFHVGSQIDPVTLNALRNYKFDVIIDDGSHNSRDQMVSFFSLMQLGCSYYIEDTHCCHESFYRQGLPYIFTAKGLLSVIADKGYSITKSKNIILIQC